MSVIQLVCVQVAASCARAGYLLGLEAVSSSFSSGAGDLGLSSISSVFCSEAPFTGMESGKQPCIDRRLNTYIAATAVL